MAHKNLPQEVIQEFTVEEDEGSFGGIIDPTSIEGDPKQFIPPGEAGISGINEDTYLEIIKARTRRKHGESETDRQIAKVLSGEAEEEAAQESAVAAQQLNQALDQLGNMVQEPITRESQILNIEEEINSMRGISDEELATKINPKTSLPFTREDWDRQINGLRREKRVAAGIEVSEQDVFAQLGTQLFGFLTNNQELIGQAPEFATQRQKERFEQSRDFAVRQFQAEKDIQILKIERLVKVSDFKNAWVKEAKQQRHRISEIILQNEHRMEEFKIQAENSNLQLAQKESNDILNNLRLLPSSQIKSALLRYNNIAKFVNGGDKNKAEIFHIFSPEEIEAHVNQKSLSEKNKLVMDINDLIFKQKKTWETMLPEDLKSIEIFLKTQGEFFNPLTGKQEFLTLKDVQITTGAFIGLTGATRLAIWKQERVEAIIEKGQIWKRRQAEIDAAEDKAIANIRASSRINVARINAASKFTQAFATGRMTGNFVKSIQNGINNAGAAVIEGQSQLRQMLKVYNNEKDNKFSSLVKGEDPDTGEPIFWLISEIREKIERQNEINNVYGNEMQELHLDSEIARELAYEQARAELKESNPNIIILDFQRRVITSDIFNETELIKDINGDLKIIFKKESQRIKELEKIIKKGG